MTEYLLDQIKKIIASILIAVIPLLIANVIIYPIFEHPEIQITALELKDHSSKISKIDVLIQNVGNVPSENIRILFNTTNSYKLDSFESTDTLPTEIKNGDKKLRIEIERLAPQSYVTLYTKGPTANITKTLWLTSNKETEIITLPSNSTDSGISSVDLNKDRQNTLYGSVAFGFAAVAAFRFLNYYRSESTRKSYLGVYEILPVKFRSKYLGFGFLILFIAFYIGIEVDQYYVPDPIAGYEKYYAFPLDDSISTKTFLQIKDPNDPYVTEGSVVFILVMIVALIVSNKDINLPKFDWSLKPPLSAIKLNQISSSYLKAKEVSIRGKQNSKDEIEIYVVKKDEKIVGLLAVEEINELKVDEKSSFKSIFKHKKLSPPKWKESESMRVNFITINEDKTLDDLKQEMEKHYKKYAVIQSADKKFIGVVEYDDLFGRPRLQI